MKIQIATQDSELVKKFEDMNMPGKAPVGWVDFYFKESMLESMWHDLDTDWLTISINGSDYHTPYTKKKFDAFKELLT